MRKAGSRSTKRFTRVRSNGRMQKDTAVLFSGRGRAAAHAIRRLQDSLNSDLRSQIRADERQSRNDRKTGTTGPSCLDLNPRRAAGARRSLLRRHGTRSWRPMGWPYMYPSARPFCPGTSPDGCCSGWSDGTLGGNGRPSATAHHCCMCRRFPFRHRRLSIRIGKRGGERDRDHRP